MKTRTWIPAALAALMVAAPAVTFAQQTDNNAPMTRAEVKAQLQQLEQAGYDPTANDPDYPANLQAAESRVAPQQGLAQAQTPATDTSGYGPATSGTTQSGAPGYTTPSRSVYFGGH